MESQGNVVRVDGSGARTSRLTREMAAARRMLSRPRPEVDEVLESVAAQLSRELAGAGPERRAAACSEDGAGEEMAPEIVCVPRRSPCSAEAS
jgi:hypothetical protein